MDKKKWKNFGLGVYLIVMPVILACFALALWHIKDDSSVNIWEGSASLFGTELIVHHEFRLILLVILAGALGSYVHAATSFVSYIGNRSFVESWCWWYVLRPFIGMALALIFYFALRGGILLLTSDANAGNISPFSIAAISGLVGLFSKHAIDKLRELFDALFKTERGKGDEERTNKLQEMRPVRDFMLGVNRITAYELKDGKTEEDVTIKELYDLLKGAITRIPVFDDKGAVKYVIHQSSLYKYISKISIGTTGAPVNIQDLTLRNFLDFEDMQEVVEKLMAFVSIEATLGDAKSEMEKTKKCQDVFVTQNGKKEEPILGWLTNIGISKHVKV